jgi:hypothetical protein
MSPFNQIPGEPVEARPIPTTAQEAHEHFDYMVNLEPWFSRTAGLHEVAPQFKEDPKGYFADVVRTLEEQVAAGDTSPALQESLAKNVAYVLALEKES